MIIIIRKNCIVCGSDRQYLVLDLGTMPSANDLPLKEDLGNVKNYPLKYYSCGQCSMFQLLEIASGEELFKNYLYVTGMSKDLVAHFKELADGLGKQLKKKDFAVVVGSNDGTEVLQLKEVGFKNAIGVEPASNIAKMAREKGAETINAPFDENVANAIIEKYGRADLITANNVFAHIPDPKGMLLAMKKLINDDGRIVIEVHWLKSLVEHLEIEALYAEHYYVWTVKAMRALADQCGLKITDVLYMPKQHGGSLRFTYMKKGEHDTRLEKEEEKAGLYNPDIMRELQTRADKRKDTLVKLIKDLKKQGKKVSIWSVPAKVPTLINFSGLSYKEIDCAYEVSPTKIGRYIPKANILIKDEKLIEKEMPDYLIIGAWNYLDFAKKSLKWYTDKGGRLINPLTCEIIT